MIMMGKSIRQIWVNAGNMVFLCKNCVKYQYASLTVCAYAHVFRKSAVCVLIGACALIKTNTVIILIIIIIIMQLSTCMNM